MQIDDEISGDVIARLRRARGQIDGVIAMIEVFTDYLNQVVPSVFSKAKNGTFTAAFPGTIPTDGSFQGASGSDGVSTGVKSKIGAITYAESSFAKEFDLQLFASVDHPIS